MAYTIGQLAKSCNVSVETIRYYERVSLIIQPTKPLQGYRKYSENDREKILFIKKAQGGGFTLNEIKELLTFSGTNNCRECRLFAEKKIDELDNKIDELLLVKEKLQKLVARCKEEKEAQCPIIETFKGGLK